LSCSASERRHFPCGRDAPRGPQVEQNQAPAPIGQRFLLRPRASLKASSGTVWPTSATLTAGDFARVSGARRCALSKRGPARGIARIAPRKAPRSRIPQQAQRRGRQPVERGRERPSALHSDRIVRIERAWANHHGRTNRGHVMSNKMWGGRFTARRRHHGGKSTLRSISIRSFTAKTLPASIAHAQMLAKQGIISAQMRKRSFTV